MIQDSMLYVTYFELSVVKIKREFPAESGCKANDLTRYKVAFYLIFNRSNTRGHYNRWR